MLALESEFCMMEWTSFSGLSRQEAENNSSDKRWSFQTSGHILAMRRGTVDRSFRQATIPMQVKEFAVGTDSVKNWANEPSCLQSAHSRPCLPQLVLIETQSNAELGTVPSTKKQQWEEVQANFDSLTLNNLLLKPNQCAKSKRASEEYFRVKEAFVHAGETVTGGEQMTQLSRSSAKSICRWEKKKKKKKERVSALSQHRN